MRLTGIVIVALALVACDGLGRGIVGHRPVVDGGEDDRCQVSPACVPLRTVPSSDFVVDPAALVPDMAGDCDADGVPDAMDPCLGVPGERCDAALAACARLASGAHDLAGADLRGCRIAGPLVVSPSLSFEGADLSCASLTLVVAPSPQPPVLGARNASWTHAVLALDSPDGPWTLDVSRTTLRRTLVRLRGGARVRADEAIVSDARFAVSPGGGGAARTAPAIELRRSNAEDSVFLEEPSAWPGRIRLERSTVRGTTFASQVLELVGSDVATSNLGASELLTLGTEVRSSAIRVDYGAISGSLVADTVFAQCVELQVSASELWNVDVPACPPDQFRVADSVIIDARIAGGLHLVESDLRTSIIGGGQGTVVRTDESNLDVVTVCDLGAAAFRGGELRCVRCDEDAFMGGLSVCVGGAELYERGCPAIELAPECP